MGDLLSRHAIIPQQQFACTTGKNASGITLVIDAMDLLHSGRFDGFCLVSSDSDFTRLAARIREQGIDMFGFGEQKTSESFRQAHRRFIYTENLLPSAAANAEVQAALPLPPDHCVDLAAAIPVIRKVTAQMETEDGWSGSAPPAISSPTSRSHPRDRCLLGRPSRGWRHAHQREAFAGRQTAWQSKGNTFLRRDCRRLAATAGPPSPVRGRIASSSCRC
jgi:hypothetical protein